MNPATLDIGNTAIKVCFAEKGSLESTGEAPTLAEAIRICGDRGVKNIAACTTRKLTGGERKMLAEAGGWLLTAEERLPVKLSYDTPGTLGADRIAAAVGAWKMFPGESVMIADIGTALTLDIVTADGRFAGGNISPGLQMRLDALHHFTSLLPRETISADLPAFGHSTAQALRCGAWWGTIYEIGGAFRNAEKLYGCGRVVLTGGGSEAIEKELSLFMEGKGEVIRCPLLVHEGLLTAYNYNHD